MPDMPQVPGAAMPQLPKFDFQTPQYGGVDIASILKLLQQPPQSMTNTVLPAMQQQLGAQGPAIAPQIAAIRGRGEELAAGAQSDAMKRGLTGSDIEAAGMLGARQGAATEEAQFRGNIALQQAQTMAQAIMQAMGMDIQANAQMYQNLAQAIGQALAQQNQMQMFQQGLSAQSDAASKAARSQQIAAIIGAIGQVGGGYAATL